MVAVFAVMLDTVADRSAVEKIGASVIVNSSMMVIMISSVFTSGPRGCLRHWCAVGEMPKAWSYYPTEIMPR